MIKAFRKYHRTLAIIATLPLILTVITGLGHTILHYWFDQEEAADFLIKFHTLEILHLEKIFPILNGIGLLGLLVTGITMTGVLRKRV